MPSVLVAVDVLPALLYLLRATCSTHGFRKIFTSHVATLNDPHRREARAMKRSIWIGKVLSSDRVMYKLEFEIEISNFLTCRFLTEISMSSSPPGDRLLSVPHVTKCDILISHELIISPWLIPKQPKKSYPMSTSVTLPGLPHIQLEALVTTQWTLPLCCRHMTSANQELTNEL